MVEASESKHRLVVVGVALAVTAFLVSFGVLHFGPFTKNLLLDTPLYERYGDAVVHGGKIPYRDFGLEYPPASILVFALPSLVAPAGDFALYQRLFEALMLLCGAGASALVAVVLSRERAGPARLVAGSLLAGLAPLLLGPVVLSRFDLWPALLTVAALAALLGAHRRTAFALLAVGTAAKLYPLVVLPLAFAYVWRRDGRRAAVSAGALFLGVLALLLVPFVAASPTGVWAAVSDQVRRPLQIESLGSSFLLVAHQLFGFSLQEVNSHGSDNLAGALPGALAAAQSALVLAALLGLWIAFARGEMTPERLIRYTAAAVCAFVAVGKVLSPQYLIWLFPLVPLVRGRRGLVAGALLAAALVLTQLWFPRHYIELAYGFDARSSWFVLARDLTLVALLATLIWPRGRARRAGLTLVAGLAGVAVAAAVTAAATAPLSGFALHSGLLTETGVPSSCKRPRSAPPLSGGTVAYAAVGLTAPGAGGRCVTVALTSAPSAELFSAAYRQAFLPGDPQANYLGDAGLCTEVAGASGRRLDYELEWPAGSRLAVEVESCGAVGPVASYLLEVYDGARPPVAYAAASATRSRHGAGLAWRTDAEKPGTSFSVYRVEEGVVVALEGRLQGRGIRGGSYRFSDPSAPTGEPVSYFLLARAGSSFVWYGPLTAGS